MQAGTWVWAGPTVIAVIWQIGSGAGWALVGETWALYAAVLLSRGLGAVLYNLSVSLHRGIMLVQEDGSLIGIPAGPAFLGLVMLSVPVGLGLGLTMNAFGWLDNVPGHWLWGWLGLPVAALVSAWATLGLYNRVVVTFYGSLSIRYESDGTDRERVVEVSPYRARIITSVLFFGWAVILLSLGITILMTLLTILAHRLPAGFFGLCVAIFTAFFVATLGFFLAALVGWWSYGGALIYNRWARQGGGLSLGCQVWEVPL